MFHISVLLKKYYVTFLYSALSYWYFENTITGPIFIFLIEIWDQKWIYLECLFPSPFLQLPLSISRAVSLMIYSGILVLLLFVHHTDLFNLVNSLPDPFDFLFTLSFSYVYNSIKVCSLLCLWLFSHICVYAVFCSCPRVPHNCYIGWVSSGYLCGYVLKLS